MALSKNVAQSIPSYCMSCFKISKTLYQEIERLMNRYLWSSSGNIKKGIIWLAWDKMGLLKSKGGLNFSNLYGFNLALLGKHCWNFVSNPHSLISRVLKLDISLTHIYCRLREGEDRITSSLEYRR